MKAVLLVFLAFLVCNATAQSCAIPIFAASNANYWYGANGIFLTTPEVESSDFCPYLDGKLQCCSASTYTTLSNIWNNAYAAVDQTVSLLDNVTSYLDVYRTEWNNVVNDINNDANIPQNTKNAIDTLGNNIFNAIDTFASTAGSYWGTCASAYLKYAAGLVCLACDANWATWVSTSDNGLDVTISIADATCTSLQNDCYPFWNSLETLITSIESAVQTYIDTLTGSSGSSGGNGGTPTLGYNDLCDADCYKFICEELVVGLDFEVNGFGYGDSKRSITTAQRTATFDSLGEHAPKMQTLFKLADKVYAIVQHKSKPARQSATVTNQYNSTGIDLYSNGANSGYETTINSGSLLSNWISFLL